MGPLTNGGVAYGQNVVTTALELVIKEAELEKLERKRLPTALAKAQAIRKNVYAFFAVGLRPTPDAPFKSAAVAASAGQSGTLKLSRLLSQPPGTRLLTSHSCGRPLLRPRPACQEAAYRKRQGCRHGLAAIHV